MKTFLDRLKAAAMNYISGEHPMPVPKDKRELFALLKESRLLEPDQLQFVLNSTSQLADEPEAVCQWLMENELITKFHAEQLLKGRHKGFIVGRYKLLARIGAGGMGRIYLAEHIVMRRRVALKFLPKFNGSDPFSLVRFQREARAVTALNHPNIVQTYDIDQDGDLQYFVLDFVEGKSLQEIVREDGPLPWGLACNYVCQSADGLEHASRSGFIHREIKPGKILVDNHGAVKLLDMGLQVFTEDKDKDSITIVNTENAILVADYLAPEQALDNPIIDTRADIYSLGCVFYYLLVGHHPFPEGTVAQKLLYHQKKLPEPVGKFRPDVPDDVVSILNWMIAKRREDRIQTPADVWRALQPFAEPRIEKMYDPADRPKVQRKPRGTSDRIDVQSGGTAESTS